MGFFRSDKILHKKIRLPRDIDSAVKILDELGSLEFDSLQFIDLTKDNYEMKKNFKQLINRCETIENILINFEIYSEMNKIILNKYDNFQQFNKDLKRDQEMRNCFNSKYFDLIENELIDKNKKFLELIDSYIKIKDELYLEIEKKLIYQKYLSLIEENSNLSFLNMSEDNHISNDLNINNISIISNNNGANNNKILFLIGITNAENEMKLKRLIFRASRGNAMSNFFNISESVEQIMKDIIINDQDEFNQNNIKNVDLSLFDSKDDFKDRKKIFLIFYPFDGKDFLKNKLIQICDIFNCSIYELEGKADEIKKEINNIIIDINDKIKILIETKKHIKSFLKNLAGNYKYKSKNDLYKIYIKKMKLIYNNLNKCIIYQNFIDGEVFVLEKNYFKLKNQLTLINQDLPNNGVFIDLYPENISYPTYIINNDFLNGFQEIVNTYGIPRYQEINPGYFNIIFFPFLFGIMFGDIGHGLILLFLSLFLLIYNEKIKKNKNSLFRIGLPYRYFILFMSICSIYCGIIYNDFFGYPFPFFDSCYTKNEKTIQKKNNCFYPFGIDIKWFSSENKLTFINSLKMKISVIFGVGQMIFGVILKGLNDFYFSQYLNVVCEFFPQLIFICLLFGYMNILIFIKWNKDFKNIQNPPSIISYMINIGIKFGSIDDNPLWGKKSKIGGYQQENFHKFIFIVCLICVFIMFVPKPLILYYNNKKKQLNEEPLNGNNNNIIDNNNIVDNEILIENEQNENIQYSYLHKEKKNINYPSMTDLIVNQVILTIEYVLGCISNTASYLRLWALSLAHSQLSEVFFEKFLLNIFKEGDFHYGFSIIIIIINFFIFTNITLFVLMFMDLLESFLHTLRLHWVEFQDKFFYADGYLFESFNFKLLFNDIEDEKEIEYRKKMKKFIN